MQDFIDIYKETFGIEQEVTLDSSLEEGKVEVTEKGFSFNAKKDPDVLELLGKIKLYSYINDMRVFNPTTEFMAILVLAWQYSIMAKQLEIVEMDLMVEKLLIKKEDSPYESYAVLKILDANPTLTGADSSLIDQYLALEPNSTLFDEIEKVENYK